MPQNSLTLVVDASGVYYRVPVCVINDPITYDKDYMTQKLKKKEAPKKEIIQVSSFFHKSIDYKAFWANFFWGFAFCFVIESKD